jgi:hypothetical protein
MTGHIDYDVDITVHGKVAMDIYDTFAGVDEMAREAAQVWRVLDADPNYIEPYTPINLFMRRHRGTVAFDAQRHLASNNIYLSHSLDSIIKQGRRRNVMFNILGLHMLQGDGSFEFKLGSPLPPNMVNRMLTAFQWYLRLWSDLGDADPTTWWNVRRRRRPSLHNTTTVTTDWGAPPSPVLELPSAAQIMRDVENLENLRRSRRASQPVTDTDFVADEDVAF